MSDDASAQPAIEAAGIEVEYLIRYHNADVTMRETLLHPARSRRRDAFLALERIDLTVHPGEIVGIIGRNGSGKSTLLRVLGGIISPDAGTLAVRGRVACLMSFGVGFNPNLTGRENIHLSGSMLGMPREEIDAVVDQIIAQSEIGDFIDAAVRTYSSGMRVRLGFAIAVHTGPDVLLLDEVLAVGDAGFRARSGDVLQRLGREHMAVVLASHSMALVQSVCTRVVWLDSGAIQLVGPPDEVCAAYLAAARAGDPAPTALHPPAA